MLLTIEKKSISPDITVLDIAGKITLGRDCKELEWAVNDLLANNSRKVILDLADVTFMDSTGIGILVMCSGALRSAGGELRVSGTKGMVDDVLRKTKINAIIPFHSTTEDAARSFGNTSAMGAA